jgi:hypothetical protein
VKVVLQFFVKGNAVLGVTLLPKNGLEPGGVLHLVAGPGLEGPFFTKVLFRFSLCCTKGKLGDARATLPLGVKVALLRPRSALSVFWGSFACEG